MSPTLSPALTSTVVPAPALVESPSLVETDASSGVEDPHGLVPLVTQLWHQFNSHEDPFRILEVYLAQNDKGQPTLTVETLYTGTPFSTEIRTFEDEAHLARYLTACLKHDTWAEKATRIAPLFRTRKEYPKTDDTADTVREVLRMSRPTPLPDGQVEQTLRRTNSRKPDVMVLCARSELDVGLMICQLARAALAKPTKTLEKLHFELIAAAEKEARAAQAEEEKKAKAVQKAAEKEAEKARKANKPAGRA